VFNRTPNPISVPAALIPYVRSGLMAEFGSANDVLGIATEVDEVDRSRWRAGLAQFDCARELLNMVGISASPGEAGLDIDLTSPRLARMFRDALRAAYDVEVERLASAESDQVLLPLEEVPALRNFIVDTERQLEKATARLQPYLTASEKRKPRSVKSRR
jgi:hypothetical protein